MQTRIFRNLLALCICLTLTGCVTYPVTSDSQYAPYLNEPHVLRKDCTLWKKKNVPSYVLDDSKWKLGSTWEGMVRVAEIPKGTPITVKSVLRTRCGIISGWRYYGDSAIVSFRQPGHPWSYYATFDAGRNFPERVNNLSKALERN